MAGLNILDDEVLPDEPCGLFWVPIVGFWLLCAAAGSAAVVAADALYRKVKR